MWARGKLKAPPRFQTGNTSANPAVDDEFAASLALFGLTLDESSYQADGDKPFHLWVENWPVWQLWRDCETQWRPPGGMGGHSPGLDYGGVDVLIRQRVRKPKRKEVFWLIQAMEDATLEVWREQKAKL